ncbi:MAG: ABC transporter substrate-binding protein [Dehalococcoidia bacterium]|nr:ABC transporter substrate-binding protein [Dehalococcoidia bacterium]
MYKNRIESIVPLFLVILVALAIVACGPSAQRPQEDAVTTTKEAKSAGLPAADKLEVAKERGGLLKYPASAFGNPNDPHLTATANGRVYSMPVTNGIIKRDIYNNFAIAPDLAKSWEASKDGFTYTFKFQEGVKFHNTPPVNGREFVSEDAKYTLLRLTADPSVIVEKWKPRFQRALDFGAIQSIETPDKYTMVVNLKEPYAPFLDAVSQPASQVIPREFVEKFPEKIITEGMIGTGPFTPNEYRNQNIASYKRNPAYWKKDSAGGQLPYIDDLALLFFADEQTRYAAFRAKQIDLTSVTGEAMKSIMKDEPNVRAQQVPFNSVFNFRFNMKFKPFQDVKVRRAMHLAVDRQQFAEIIGQDLAIPAGPVTPIFPEMANTMDWLLSQPGYRKDKTQDLEEAKRLMNEAGYGDGFEVKGMFSLNTGDHISLLQDQLKPLKITLKADQVDYAGQWVPKATAGEFELSYMTHVFSTDADSILTAHLTTGGPRNYGKFSDAALDDLVMKQRTATNLEERRKWAQEAEKRALEVLPFIFVYSPFNTSLVQPWVHNAGNGPLSDSLPFIVEQAWVEKH